MDHADDLQLAFDVADSAAEVALPARAPASGLPLVELVRGGLYLNNFLPEQLLAHLHYPVCR
jgi:hypothetical protein